MTRGTVVRLLRSSLYSLLLIGSYCSKVAAQSVVSGTEGVTALFPITGGVAAFDESAAALVMFGREGSALKERQRYAVNGSVWGVAEGGGSTFVVVGMGRRDLSAPLKVLQFDQKGSARTIFEHQGERNQASQLTYRDGRLWLTYFESKYMTRTGYCKPHIEQGCSFVEVARMRLGDAVDVSGDLVVIGRPYGDIQGQDGDLILVEKGQQTLLPSYRGVRSVAFFGNGSDKAIAIGDGWHQNYGQIAQGRLSILTRKPDDSRYALTLIDRDAAQYGFAKIVPFTQGGAQFLAVLGNRTLSTYGPAPQWNKREWYVQSSVDTPLDVALIESSSSNAWFAVLDKGIRLIEVKSS